jgi:hypothetical protein
MQPKELGSPSCSENIPHPNGPKFPADASKRHVFDVQTAVQKEGEARTESIHVEAAATQQFHVSEPIRQGEGRLLHGSGARLGDVVPTDRDRVPSRHMFGRERDGICQKAKRSLEREDDLVLSLHLLEDVRLRCSAQLSKNARTRPAFRGGHVHGQDNRRRSIDRHRDGEMRIVQPKAGVEPFHVVYGINCYAAFSDLTEDTVRIAVEAVERGSVECGAETHGSLLMGEIVEAFVRVFGKSEASEKPCRLLAGRWQSLCVPRLLLVAGALVA